MTHLKPLITYAILWFVIDRLVGAWYPAVDPLRALQVAAIAFGIAAIPVVKKFTAAPAGVGFVSVLFASLFGSMLIQDRVIQSGTLTAIVAHLLILIAAYFLVVLVEHEHRKQKL